MERRRHHHRRGGARRHHRPDAGVRRKHGDGLAAACGEAVEHLSLRRGRSAGVGWDASLRLDGASWGAEEEGAVGEEATGCGSALGVEEEARRSIACGVDLPDGPDEGPAVGSDSLHRQREARTVRTDVQVGESRHGEERVDVEASLGHRSTPYGTSRRPVRRSSRWSVCGHRGGVAT